MRQRTTFPEDMRCVVLIGIDFDGPSHEVGRGIAPLGKHSWGNYSARCGVPRHMDMLARHDIKGTFFIPGYDAERHPAIVEQIDRNGYEVAAHGYLHEAWELGVEEEEALLRKTDRILHDVVGKPVLGWRSPSGRKSDRTMAVLKSMGYIYDSSDKDYDRPYRLRFGQGQDDVIVELPNNTYSLDDFPFYKFSHTPPSEVLAQWKAEFDAIYGVDRFFVLSLHPRAGWGSGTPAHTRILSDLITYMKGHDGVRFMEYRAFAQWCQQHRDNLEEVSFA
ncbi:polysaccharide deacetylase family protein [Achromobacter aloeverae]|uniref:Chitin deacetylase n=1 Tax=Achromobacter aloeverae TaxID=1750518 RepID=A0A4Q1HI13_9BURK|nr:polysaccharide deacetylase family protein [Achromobacter aloeverae]RXN87862.1 chitin deacetylase [Achromobacter aloeverae]